MNEKEFCYWLQGFFELTGKQEITPEQAKMIQEHLQTVFNKVTPPLQQPWPGSGLVQPRPSPFGQGTGQFPFPQFPPGQVIC